MVSDLSALLGKTEDDLRKYAQAMTGDGLNALIPDLEPVHRSKKISYSIPPSMKSKAAVSN